MRRAVRPSGDGAGRPEPGLGGSAVQERRDCHFEISSGVRSTRSSAFVGVAGLRACCLGTAVAAEPLGAGVGYGGGMWLCQSTVVAQGRFLRRGPSGRG